MTQDIIIDGCKCTCQNAQLLLQESAKTDTRLLLETGLVVLIIVLVGVGLVVGFLKLKGDGN